MEKIGYKFCATINQKELRLLRRWMKEDGATKGDDDNEYFSLLVHRAFKIMEQEDKEDADI